MEQPDTKRAKRRIPEGTFAILGSIATTFAFLVSAYVAHDAHEAAAHAQANSNPQIDIVTEMFHGVPSIAIYNRGPSEADYVAIECIVRAKGETSWPHLPSTETPAPNPTPMPIIRRIASNGGDELHQKLTDCHYATGVPLSNISDYYFYIRYYDASHQAHSEDWALRFQDFSSGKQMLTEVDPRVPASLYHDAYDRYYNSLPTPLDER